MIYRQKTPNDDNDSKKKISPHTCKNMNTKFIYIYIYILIYIIYYSYNS